MVTINYDAIDLDGLHVMTSRLYRKSASQSPERIFARLLRARLLYLKKIDQLVIIG